MASISDICHERTRSAVDILENGDEDAWSMKAGHDSKITGKLALSACGVGAGDLAQAP